MNTHSNKLVWLGIAFAVLALLAGSALFTVTERQYALVFRFGQFKVAYTEPGLKLKMPFVDEVVTYTSQVLQLVMPPVPIQLQDDKYIDVDMYAYYRIHDPLKFYLQLSTLKNADERLATGVDSSLRSILGEGYNMQRLLSDARSGIMQQMQERMKPIAANLGVELLEVRIRRTELPAETRDALYQRMISERQRIAKEIRAQGEEEAQQIRAKADRERTVLLAESERDAQKLRGEGDAAATAIYAEALNSDPEFYAFYRSLEAYRNALANKDTALVLSPDSEFFRYFGGVKAGQ